MRLTDSGHGRRRLLAGDARRQTEHLDGVRLAGLQPVYLHLARSERDCLRCRRADAQLGVDDAPAGAERGVHGPAERERRRRRRHRVNDELLWRQRNWEGIVRDAGRNCQRCGKELSEICGKELSEMREGIVRDAGRNCQRCGKELSEMREGIVRDAGRNCQRCGKELSEMWEGIVRDAGRNCQRCGKELSEMWEGIVRDVGRNCQRCGKELSEMREGIVRDVGRNCQRCGNELSADLDINDQSSLTRIVCPLSLWSCDSYQEPDPGQSRRKIASKTKAYVLRKLDYLKLKPN